MSENISKKELIRKRNSTGQFINMNPINTNNKPVNIDIGKLEEFFTIIMLYINVDKINILERLKKEMKPGFSEIMDSVIEAERKLNYREKETRMITKHGEDFERRMEINRQKAYEDRIKREAEHKRAIEIGKRQKLEDQLASAGRRPGETGSEFNDRIAKEADEILTKQKPKEDIYEIVKRDAAVISGKK